jgi:hypothetical protein
MLAQIATNAIPNLAIVTHPRWLIDEQVLAAADVFRNKIQ